MVLSDLITENLVLLGALADTKEAALRQTFEALYREGYVEETYYEALMERERKYPTGLRLSVCDIAIPHVTPEYVIHTGIAVAILRKTVKFQCVDDPKLTANVRIIFNIALDREGKQVEVLQKLVEFISDQTVLAGLLSAKSPAEIVKLVGKAEKA